MLQLPIFSKPENIQNKTFIRFKMKIWEKDVETHCKMSK